MINHHMTIKPVPNKTLRPWFWNARDQKLMSSMVFVRLDLESLPNKKKQSVYKEILTEGLEIKNLDRFTPK